MVITLILLYKIVFSVFSHFMTNGHRSSLFTNLYI